MMGHVQEEEAAHRPIWRWLGPSCLTLSRQRSASRESGRVIWILREPFRT